MEAFIKLNHNRKNNNQQHVTNSNGLYSAIAMITDNRNNPQNSFWVTGDSKCNQNSKQRYE